MINNKLATSSLKHDASQLMELNKLRKEHLSGKSKFYALSKLPKLQF